MPLRKRNNQRDYARRIARGLKLGLTRSAARGHPRAGERTKEGSAPVRDPRSREESALKMMRDGSSLDVAAGHFRMSRERLRAYLKENTEATRERGKWKILDLRPRQFPFYSNARLVIPWLAPDEASEAGRYVQSVGRFRDTGDQSFLAPFVGKGVRDQKGKFYPFELDENTLYELEHRDELAIPEQYRIGNRSTAT